MPRSKKIVDPVTLNDISDPKMTNTPKETKPVKKPKHTGLIQKTKLNDKNKTLLQEHAQHHTKKHMERMIHLMENHKISFKKAHTLAMEDVGK